MINLKKDQKVFYNNQIVTIWEIWKTGTIDAKDEEREYYITTYEYGYTFFIPIEEIKIKKIYKQLTWDDLLGDNFI